MLRPTEPIAYGLIDSDEQTIVDENGFLNPGPGDGCSQKQRKGRGRSLNHLVYALLPKAGEATSTTDWTPPYADLLKIELAAVGLSYEGIIAAIGPRSAPVRVAIRDDFVDLGVLKRIGTRSSAALPPHHCTSTAP